MLNKLRRRLTLIFTLLTALSLTGAMAFALYMAVGQEKESQSLSFSNTVDQVLFRLSVQKEFDEDWFTTFEKDNQAIVILEQDGSLVDFPPGWRTELDRQLLWKYLEQEVASGTTNQEDITTQGVTAFFMDRLGVINSSNIAIASPITTSSAIISAQAVESGEEAVSSEYAIDVPVGGYSAVIYVGQIGEYYGGTFQSVMLQGFISENEPIMNIAILQDTQRANQQMLMLYFTYGGIWLAGILVLLVINWFLARIVLRSTEKNLESQKEFIAAASHELRSPLAAINSSLAAALGGADQAKAERFYKAAQAESERMGRLVNDLLILAGGDVASWQLRLEDIDLDTVLIESVERYYSLMSKNNLHLKLELPDTSLPTIKGDEDRIMQILAVLLDNALRYAPAQSEVVLKAAVKRNKVTISVIDHGEGVNDEEKRRIFERFYRSDKSRNQRDHFGLGLAVAKELALTHQGDLSILDTPGGGATFVLELPLKPGKGLGMGSPYKVRK